MSWSEGDRPGGKGGGMGGGEVSVWYRWERQRALASFQHLVLQVTNAKEEVWKKHLEREN